MKKFLPYILILVILSGLLSPMFEVHAQYGLGSSIPGQINTTLTPTQIDAQIAAKEAEAAANKAGDNEFEQQFKSNAIAPCMEGTFTINISGCLVRIFYYLFYVFASWVLALSAYFFNSLISISLGSALLAGSTFIESAWIVVRDLSNIFFILILLYIGIKMILGIGGHDTKKMIAKVIILALLINFSMLMTKVVIDTSNILALIFYNKLDVVTKDVKGNVRPSTLATKDGPTKDLAGSMVNSFNPASALTWQTYFAEAKLIHGPDGYPLQGCTSTSSANSGCFETFIPAGPILGITIVSGIVMFVAAYAFFISGISFLGRLIELWVLIIFSPFAFMSSTIPILGHIEYIGWDAWFKRLFAVSFMAPIFMFFMYFIFLLLQKGNPFKDQITSTGMLETILKLVIPALLIVILLHHATKFAKKGSGVVGDVLVKTAGVATGLVVGGGIGLAAKGLQATAGVAGKAIFDNTKLTESAAKGNRFARTLKSIGGGATGEGGLAGASFDLRKGIVGTGLKLAGEASGINLGHDSKLFSEEGGHMADIKRKRAKDLAYAEGLKLAKSSDEQRKLRQLEGTNQKMALGNEHAVHEKTKKIDDAKAEHSTLKGISDSWIGDKTQDKDGNYKNDEYRKALEATNNAATKVLDLEREKGQIRKGYAEMMVGEDGEKKIVVDADGKAKFNTDNGNMSELEYADITEARKKIKEEDGKLVEATKKHALAEQAAAEATNKARELKEKADSVINPASDAVKAEAKSALLAAELAQKDLERQKGILANSDATIKISKKFLDKYTSDVLDKADEDKKKDILGKGQNVYETTLIPNQQHHIKEINDEYRQNYANVVAGRFALPWNESINEETAHDIRMNVKAEKSGGKSGGHGPLSGFMAHLTTSLAAGAIGGHAATEDKKDDHSTPAPTAPAH